MKHAPDATPLVRVLDWLGIEATSSVIDKASRFKDLLETEGIEGGIIGPNEIPRLWSRHVADSVCFLAGVAGRSWLDVGSGGGLPGIPLAICRPDAVVTLIDRSGRRVDAARRWARVLDLENIEVIHGDVEHHDAMYDTLLFRGSLGLDAAITCTRRLAGTAGVFGYSHGVSAPPVDRTGLLEVLEIPPTVLDSGVTLLRITP